MTNENQPPQGGHLREIAPFNPEAAGPDQTLEDAAIAVDELENMRFAVLTLLIENTNANQEQRAAITVLGAMLPHLNTLRQHCAQ